MAHVKLNDALKGRIRDNVFKPFNIRIEELTQSLAANSVLASIAYFTTVSQEEYACTRKLHEVTKLNHAWFRYDNELIVRIQEPTGQTTQVRMRLPDQRPFPANHSTWNVFAVIRPDNVSPEVYAQFTDPIVKVRKLQADCANLNETLLKPVFHSCNTVKQALKLWPSIVDFLPSDALAVHRTRAVREPRKQVNTEVVEISDDAKQLLAKVRMMAK